MDLIVLGESFGAYMKVSGKFLKLEGFSKLDFNLKSNEYTRKYLLNGESNTDITDKRAEISYAFDKMANNLPHEKIANILSLGKGGKQAIAELLIVDFSKEDNNKFEGVKQKFVLSGGQKQSQNGFLSYRGTMVGTGKAVLGFVSLNDDLKSAEFTQKRRGILCDLNS